MRKWLILFASVVACLAGASRAPAAPERRELWLYYPINFLVEANVDKAQDIWTRAAKAGYTHVLVPDSKFAHLQDMPKRYFDNVGRAKHVASELKLTLVPALFDVGYSNNLLFNDPNLAEGLPVKDSLFVVHDGQAHLALQRYIAVSP